MPDQLAPQNRRERRWSQQARADRERRRVRATNGSSSNRSKRPIVIQVGGPKRRRRRVRSRKHGVLAALWSLITAAFTIAWLLTGLILWGVAGLLAGLVTVVATIAMFDPDAAVPAQPARKPRTASSRGNGSARPRRSSSGTVPKKPKKKVCSIRCRNSTKDVSTCECVCGGKSHGAAHRGGNP